VHPSCVLRGASLIFRMEVSLPYGYPGRRAHSQAGRAAAGTQCANHGKRQDFADRNRKEADIRAAHLAIAHYQAALKAEHKLTGS
jgi:hypothetical protein